MVLAGGHIRYTPEGVGGDHGLDDGVKRRHVRDRVRQFPNRTLGFATLNEVSHFFYSTLGRRWVKKDWEWGVLSRD
jgi:hypothetical protein